MDYYGEIKQKFIKCELYDRAKEYAKDRNRVDVYFEIGRILNKAGKKYGQSIIRQYSRRLTIELGKKYNERTLRRIRQFYEVFRDKNWSITWTNLCWSHYREVLSLGDVGAMEYYLEKSNNENLTIRQLQLAIKNDEYSRLTDETKNRLANQENVKMGDLVPDPIIIVSDNDKDNLSEYFLQQAIMNGLEDFLRQLGEGFAYVGNEFRVKIGGRYNYIDLLLFNYKYNCFVVVELKATELKKEHIGQTQVYMNYVNRHLKNDTQDKTVGIIICSKNNKYVIEYCSDEKIISREFELI